MPQKKIVSASVEEGQLNVVFDDDTFFDGGLARLLQPYFLMTRYDHPREVKRGNSGFHVTLMDTYPFPVHFFSRFLQPPDPAADKGLYVMMGQALHVLRKARDLNQESLAARIGMARETLNRIERAVFFSPSTPAFFQRALAALDADPVAFILEQLAQER
jgi:hypothetical protein